MIPAKIFLANSGSAFILCSNSQHLLQRLVSVIGVGFPHSSQATTVIDLESVRNITIIDGVLPRIRSYHIDRRLSIEK